MALRLVNFLTRRASTLSVPAVPNVTDKEFTVLNMRALPQRTSSGLSDELFKISLDFYENLHGINFGKAHSELLNKMTVFSFGEYVNLESAARCWVKDDKTIHVECLEQSNAPIIEHLITSNTDWGATTKRTFENIEVTIGVDPNALEKMNECELVALDAISQVKDKYAHRVDGDPTILKQIDTMSEACLARLEAYKSQVLEYAGVEAKPMLETPTPKIAEAAAKGEKVYSKEVAKDEEHDDMDPFPQ